jgi:methylenetetrahydrofolate reductase (NADPH)
MKITELWKSVGRPTVSFELFPAKTAKAAADLETSIDILAALQPDFVSVTFGAGGSTRDGSRQLVEKLKREKGLEVVAYFAGYGLGPDEVVSVMNDYQTLGIENILAVRGDEPKEEGFLSHPDCFHYASDLVSFIRPRYKFCLAVAGYPEGHIQAANKHEDLAYLKQKVELGADYVICNYFYDNSYFFDFAQRCREAGIAVPILPGIMPIYSIKMMETLAGICGATITPEVRRGIAALPEGDKEALLAFGIDLAVRQCQGLLESGVPGIHIFTLNQHRAAGGIVKRLRGEGLLRT